MSLINRKHGVLSYVIINLCGSVSILLDMLKCSTPKWKFFVVYYGL